MDGFMDTERDAEHVSNNATTSSEGVKDGFTDSMRITRQGKLRIWVKKALDFFESYPEKPLMLYSSPADVSNSTIPRLLSVVEIIKREYLKGLDVSAGNVYGLHQYNQLLSEEPGKIPTEDGADRQGALAVALEGQSHAKRVFAPYMRITLSRKALEERRETYQAPSMRRLSKTAKARMRRRMRREG